MGSAQLEGLVTLGTVKEWGMGREHPRVGRIMVTGRCETELALGQKRLRTVRPVSRAQRLLPQVRVDGYEAGLV